MSAAPRRILCAIDFSPTGERSQQAAVALARSFAAELSCNPIVLGTHERHGLIRLLLGSVAESVLRRCPVPLLAVRT